MELECPFSCLQVGVAIGGRDDGMGVQHQSDRHLGRNMAGRLDAETMGKVDVVHGRRAASMLRSPGA